ncbi:alpha/beta fold hydrolase, partial [Mycolicibacterium conceptionense]
MDLRVPTVNIAGRWARGGLGAFVSETAFEHFLGAYRAGMATLPPFELFDVPTSFGTVRAYRFGGAVAGAPVVLLPGRNASTPMYRTNLGPLLQQRTVYAIDLLGEAGLSVQHKSIRDAVDQAQWLDEALAGLGVEQAHLLGVSIGGWT